MAEDFEKWYRKECEPKQTFDEWFAEEQARLVRFNEWWKSHRESEPEHFPETLTPGDWDEQYGIWND